MEVQSPPDYNLPTQQEKCRGPSHTISIEHTEQVLTPYGEKKKREEYEQELQRLADEERRRQETAFLFTDKTIRNAFIRKVYAILTMQLVVVGIVVVCIHSDKSLKMFFSQTIVVMIIFLSYVFLTCVMCCCVFLLRIIPLNFILLFTFSVLMGICVFYSTLRFSLDTVLIALGITGLIFFFVTVFAFQTSIDFTSYWLYAVLVTIVFLYVILILIFFVPTRPVEVIVGCIGVLLFSFWLAYDTQLMIGGKHRYAFSPEDYALASLCLFMDVVNIFTNVLQILGADN